MKEKHFAAEYNHQGKRWCLDFYADDWADAERKIRSIGANGRVMGEIQMEAKVPSFFGRVAQWLGFGVKA